MIKYYTLSIMFMNDDVVSKGESKGESLFDNFGLEAKRTQMQNLLSDYSRPGDPLIEAIQNATDGITMKKLTLFNKELGVKWETFETALKKANNQAVAFDVKKATREHATWASPSYRKKQKEIWLQFLARELGLKVEDVAAADRRVQKRYRGKIRITRLTHSRTFKIWDNGGGIQRAVFSGSLKKGGSGKRGNDGSISIVGERGTGRLLRPYRVTTSSSTAMMVKVYLPLRSMGCTHSRATCLGSVPSR